jgi:hypothetical protein
MRYFGAVLSLASVAAASCDADNCLRALRATQVPGQLQTAQAFCATFTKTSVPATAIPSYAANNCKDNQNAPLSARISSACSCIAPSTTSSATTATPTATGSACALVSQLSASQKAASPSGESIGSSPNYAYANQLFSNSSGSCKIGTRVSLLGSISERCWTRTCGCSSPIH